MKRSIITLALLLAIVGCSKFANNVFRTEQAITGVAYTAYVGYTNGLASGAIKVSVDESNAVKSARLKLAASLATVDSWMDVYQTNATVEPQVQAALDAAIANSSNVVYLINLFKNK